MYNLPDGRKKRMTDIKEVNRAKIIDFLEKNPNSTKTECAKELNLSHRTITNHLNELNAEQKPEKQAG